MTIPPGGTIGILGGGQLGRMTALAAARLGYRCHVFAPEQDSPAADVSAHFTSAGWNDRAALDGFAKVVDVVTLEFENVPVAAVEHIAAQRPVRPGPRVLAAHSMGGHLALRDLAERRVDPDALVLSAPMLGLPGKGSPVGVLHAVARVMARLGDPRRPAWKWSEKPGQVPRERIRLLTHDEARYADELWWRDQRPELVMGPGSWGWVERALASIRGLERPGVLENVTTPVFITATTADRLVDFAAIQRAAGRLPNAELQVFGPEARHEILREVDVVRDKALAAIDDFLDRVAPKQD